MKFGLAQLEKEKEIIPAKKLLMECRLVLFIEMK